MPFDLIHGAGGGGKGGGGATHVAAEDPNNLQSKAVAKVIDLVSEGEIVGLAAGAQSLFFDRTPLQNRDGTYNFSGVVFDVRYGLPNQAIFGGFKGYEATFDVSTEVTFTGGPIARTIPVSTGATAISVVARFPALFSQDTTNGDMHGTYAQIAIEIAVDGGAFVTYVNDTIKGKTVSMFERAYRITLPAATTNWTVRMSRTNGDSNTSAVQNKTFFGFYTLISDLSFTYPDSAMVALTVDAQAFGGRIPTRGYELYGLKVNVPTNYDPVNRTYATSGPGTTSGIWDGTFKKAWTNNPAWVLYDLLTHPRYGLGDVLSATFVDAFTLYTIAQYCDGMVDDGKGGLEPRFRYNGCINTMVDAFTALQTIAASFRGMMFWGSGWLTAVQDAPGTPVKLVSPANVLNGMFSYSGTSLKARHSVVFVTWFDPTDGYRPAVEVVEDADQINLLGWRKLDYTAWGCTSRGQAIRMAKWVLDTEKNETELVTYSASYDHADVLPGQLIQLHDPDYAGIEAAGRVVDASVNYALMSSRLNSSPWSVAAGTTVTEAALTASDGTPMSLLSDSTGASNGVSSQAMFIDNDPLTRWVSVYCKAGTAGVATIRVTLSGGSTPVDVGICVNGSGQYTKLTGAAAAPASVDVKLVDAGQSIYRIRFPVTNNGTGHTSLSVQIFPATNTALNTPVNSLTTNTNAPAATTGTFYFGGVYVTEARAASPVFDRITTTGAAAPAVEVDRPLTIAAGKTYTLALVLPSGTREVTSTLTDAVGTTTTLHWSGVLSGIPDPNAMYVLMASDLTPRIFRVILVREVDTTSFEVTALEHDSTKFARVEQGISLPRAPVTLLPAGALKPPSAPAFQEYTYKLGSSPRSGVLVSWTPAPDPRVADYLVEVMKPGATTFDAPVVSVNPTFDYQDTVAGTYVFRIRARESGPGRISNAVSISANLVALGSPLPNVSLISTQFIAGHTNLIWPAVSDSREPDYEIRKGPSFASAQVLGRTPLTKYPAEGDGTYWVTAHFRTAQGVDIYSAAPATTVLSGSVKFDNIITAFDEVALGWPGTYSNLALTSLGLQLNGADNILTKPNVLALASYLWPSGVASSGIYTPPTPAQEVNIGRVDVITVAADVTGRGISVNDNILGVADLLGVVDLLGDGNGVFVRVTPQIRLAQADHVFGAWQDYRMGDYRCQYIQHRLVLSTLDNQIVGVATAYKLTIDVPDLEQSAVAVSILSGGSTITYPKPFNGGQGGASKPTLLIQVENALEGDRVVRASETLTSFAVQVTNGGVGVARTITWKATGF